MSTCKGAHRLDLETLESWLIMSKNLPRKLGEMPSHLKLSTLHITYVMTTQLQPKSLSSVSAHSTYGLLKDWSWEIVGTSNSTENFRSGKSHLVANAEY